MSPTTITLGLHAADFSQLRWAISPAWELLASIRSLVTPAAHAVHMPWLTAHGGDPLLRATRTAAARDLTAGPRHHLPGFLAPTPESPLTGIADELARVAATPVDVVRRDIRGVFPDGVPASLVPMLRAPRRELTRAVGDLHGYWRRAMEPTWPRIRGLIESDIHHRARTLTEHGPAAMFRDIHADLTWHPDSNTLSIANRRGMISDPHRSLRGRGLVMVPSAFAWPYIYVKTAPPWTPVIRYPVRGVGTLWEPRAGNLNLAAALGATRTRLLVLLETPANTDELARRTGLAAGGVSAQLHRLLDAGLVSAHRTGRSVLYARTRRAEALFT
jgi:DNA-binding transcriptional ArsR family regulator